MEAPAGAEKATQVKEALRATAETGHLLRTLEAFNKLPEMDVKQD